MADLEQLNDNLSNSINDETAAGHIKSAIQALSDSILAVDKNTAAIASNIENLSSQVTGAIGDQVKKLLAREKTERKAFIDELWKSRTLAGTSEAICRDLVNSIFPSILEDAEYAKDIIDEEISLCKGKNDGGLKKNFDELAQKAEAFAAEWQKLVALAEQTEDQVHAKWEKVEAKVKALDLQLKAAIDKAQKELAAQSSTTSIFSSICAKIFTSTIAKAAEKTKGDSDIKRLSKELQAAETEAEKLEKDLFTLRNNNGVIADIAGKLRGIPSEYSNVANQVLVCTFVPTLIINDIKDLPKLDPDALKSRTTSLGVLYKALADALKVYQTKLK